MGGTDKHAQAAASKGLALAEWNNSLNVAGEFLFAGHNTPANVLVNSLLPGGVTQRWQRDWYIQKTIPTGGSGIDAKLVFDFHQAGFSLPKELGSRLSNYCLLYRSSSTGTFQVVSNSPTLEGTAGVGFLLENTALNTGYYTLGIINAAQQVVEYCPGERFALPFNNCSVRAETFTAQLSSKDLATFPASPVTLGSGNVSPLSVTLPANLQPGLYQVRIAASDGTTYVVATLQVKSCEANTITLGDVTGNPFCTTGPVSASAPFTTTGYFAPGQKFTAQTVNTDGTFTSVGESTASPVPVTLPAGTSTYRVRIIAGEVISGNVITLSVSPEVTVTLQSSAAGDVCQGTAVTFTATSSSPDATYTFRSGGVELQKGRLNTYTTTTLTHNQQVVVEVSAPNGCSALSSAVTTGVKPVPTVALSRVRNTSCSTVSNGALSFSIAGAATTYTLLKFGVPVAGYTNQPVSVTGLTGLSAGRYQLLVQTEGGCSVRSNEVEIQEGKTEVDLCTSTLRCTPAAQSGQVSFRIRYRGAPPDNFQGGFLYQIRRGNQVIVPQSALLPATQQGGDDLYGTGNGTDWSGTVTINDAVAGAGAGYVLDVWLATSLDPDCQVCRENGCIASFPFSFQTPAITLQASQTQYFVCSQTDQAEVPVDLLATVSACNSPGLDGYTLTLTNTADGSPVTPAEDNVVSNTGTRIEVKQRYQLSPGRYRIATAAGPGTYGCTAETFIEVTPLGLQVAVATTRTGCEEVVARASVSGNVTGRISYLWYRKNPDTGVYEPYPSAAAPFVGAEAELTEVGEYQLQVGQEQATCLANATFTVTPRAPLTGIALSEIVNCALKASVIVPEADRYRVVWYAKEADLPKSASDVPVYTEYVDAAAGATLESTLPEEHLLQTGYYYVRIYDRWNCPSESAQVEKKRPIVARNYNFCVQWESFPPVQEPPPVVDAQTMPQLMASDTRRVIDDAIGQCIENQKKIIVALANPEKCLENVKDALVLTYNQNYYHYTLYYYDRGGNLTKTVPPAGVEVLAGTDLKRTVGIRPAHRLTTTYDYNSLGQLMRQQTPDGGATFFVYNRQGQLRLSQNERQKVTENNAYSYTKYDELGRVVEVGQAQPAAGSAPAFGGTIAPANETLLAGDQTQGLAPANRFPSAAQAALSQQTVTVYSEPSPDGIAYLNRTGSPQRYLRNRVSYSFATNRADGSRIYTYYSYDPHGNVEWLTQDMPGAGRNFVGYEYDLISGKVLKVRFNEHRPDRFFHRYFYDEDNRLTNVETSRDGFLWDRDANYHYYGHGPLRRLALGQDSIQGLDYTYTIHGWLKGINAPTADLANDPGGDQATAGNPFARDEFAMALGYYKGDFRYNGSVFDAANTAGLYTGFTATDLFNGNISSWMWRSDRAPATAGGNFVTEGHSFRYDLLNRLRSSDRSVQSAGTWTPGNALRTTYRYDGNGNLLNLTRSDQNGAALDNLTYNYAQDAAGKITSNRLTGVSDAVAATAATEDPEGATAYTYDRIGNLVTEVNAATNTDIRIDWNVYGKVSEVIPTDLSRPRIRYRYDAAGNRVAKLVSRNGAETDVTYYVRDASGNILATYDKRGERSGEPLQLLEQPIYGSDRIGQRQQPVFIQSTLGSLTRDGYAFQWTKQSGPNAVLETPSEPDLRLSGLLPGTYVFRLSVTDPQGGVSSDEVTLVVPAPVYPKAGSISYERWDNIPGAAVMQVPVNTAPSLQAEYTIFETPADAGDNFAARLRGYVHPPVSGYYRFRIASDDQSELYLSTGEDPSLKRKIAGVIDYTMPRDWTKYPSQQSGQVYLEAGRRYYIEALHKESLLGDHLAVGWQLPDGTPEQPIPGNRLSGYLAPAAPTAPLYPTISLGVAPATSVPARTLVTLRANATDADGTVARVEYFVNDNKIGEDTEAPFEYVWTPLQAGYYTLTAKVTQRRGGGLRRAGSTHGD